MDNQKLLDLLGETQRALLDKQTSLDAGEPTREEYESMRQVVLGTKEQLRKQEADASYWKQQFDSQLRAWEAAQTSNGFLKKDLRLAKRRAEEAEILRLQTEAKLKAILAEEAKDGLSLLDPSDLGGLSCFHHYPQTPNSGLLSFCLGFHFQMVLFPRLTQSYTHQYSTHLLPI